MMISCVRVVWCIILIEQFTAKKVDGKHASGLLYSPEKRGLSQKAFLAASFTMQTANLISQGSRSYGISVKASSYESEKHQRFRRSIGETVRTSGFSLCPPWDSCYGRCGRASDGLPFICSCDVLCQEVGDCCVDFPVQCDISLMKGISPNNELGDRSKVIHSHCEEGRNQNALPFLAVSECPADWKNVTLRNECEGKRDNESGYEILDHRGMAYAHLSCAVCNNVSVVKGVNDSSPQVTPRLCYPSIHTCPKLDTKNQSHNLEQKCVGYSGVVVRRERSSHTPVYKNVFCALCNGEELPQLTCPTWVIDPSNSYNIFQKMYTYANDTSAEKNKFIGDIKGGDGSNDMPASFSILLNFGLDGKERMMFSSDDEEQMRRNQKKCGKTHIWDPFAEICRQLYCSAEFVLVDFHCVRRDSLQDDESDHKNEVVERVDVESKCANITLTFSMNCLDLARIAASNNNLTDSFQKGFVEVFNIDGRRVVNATVTDGNPTLNCYNQNSTNADQRNDTGVSYSMRALQGNFQLCDSNSNDSNNETTVDKIVSTLASLISMNAFYLNIADINTKVTQIHQSLMLLESWCGPDSGGFQKEYWNADFAVILDNSSDESESWIKEVYINSTGKTYQKGQFVGNILFQAYSFSDNLVNVSGVVIVCEDQSCTRVRLKKEEFEILPNKSLLLKANEYKSKIIGKENYLMSENDSVIMCITLLYMNPLYMMYRYEFDSTQETVSLVFLIISIVALFLVLLTYAILPDLRNLPGCNMMHLSGTLFMMQLTFLLGQRKHVQGLACKIAGVLLHYVILVSFFWMNVMSFDLCRTFGNKTLLTHIRSKKKNLPQYMLYAYCAPLSIITAALVLNNTDTKFSPHYGKDSLCWINNRYAALLFFMAPLAIIVIVNLAFFCKIILALREVQKMVNKNINKQQGKSDLYLYFRMATVMGFTWAFGFAAPWFPNNKILREVLNYLFIIFNTLQGVFIFFAFVCNRRVAKLYKQRWDEFCSKAWKRCPHCDKFFCFCSSKSIIRTISRETTISTLSSSNDKK